MSKDFFTILNEQKKTIDNLYYIYNSTPKKISKGYVIINQEPRLFYSSFSLPFSFTGDYSKIITQNDYSIYQLTTSGTLVILREDIEFWMCGGGGGGGNTATISKSPYAGSRTPGAGGGGGYFIQADILPNTYSLIIGQGGEAEIKGESTTLKSLDETSQWLAEGGYPAYIDGYYVRGGDGSSGGAANKFWNPSRQGWVSFGYGGKGINSSTIPFEDTSLSPHCAGGGSGATDIWKGTIGGSNGSNGTDSDNSERDESYPSIMLGGKGGLLGGGDGGNANRNTAGIKASNGQDATFFGGGGGGAAFSRNWSDGVNYNGGKGYQGVCYLKVPL